jgi:hypothetical protein
MNPLRKNKPNRMTQVATQKLFQITCPKIVTAKPFLAFNGQVATKLLIQKPIPV